MQFSLHLCSYTFFSIKPPERGIIYLTVVSFCILEDSWVSNIKWSSFKWKTELLYLGPELITPRETEDPLLSRYIYIYTHTTLLEVRATIPFITLCKTLTFLKSQLSLLLRQRPYQPDSFVSLKNIVNSYTKTNIPWTIFSNQVVICCISGK